MARAIFTGFHILFDDLKANSLIVNLRPLDIYFGHSQRPPDSAISQIRVRTYLIAPLDYNPNQATHTEVRVPEASLSTMHP